MLAFPCLPSRLTSVLVAGSFFLPLVRLVGTCGIWYCSDRLWWVHDLTPTNFTNELQVAPPNDCPLRLKLALGPGLFPSLEEDPASGYKR